MITVSIYNNVNSVSHTISVDFVADVLAGSFTPLSTAVDYFIKFTTSDVDADGNGYHPRIAFGLDDLALNGNKRSKAPDSNVAYPDIRTMVIDYTYDYIYGHTANQFSSGCSAQSPMRF